MTKDKKTYSNKQNYLPTIESNTTKIVDSIGQIRITGNIVPPLWYQHITYLTAKGKSKTNYLAVLALSDLIYWYTPKINRCELTGGIKSVLRRFKEDKLQRQYKQYAKQFKTDARTVKAAIDLLTDLHLITREFRDIATEQGLTLSNVMYLEPIPTRILHITHNPNPLPYVPPPTKICTTPPTKICTTYTETTKYRESITTESNKNYSKDTHISDLDNIE